MRLLAIILVASIGTADTAAGTDDSPLPQRVRDSSAIAVEDVAQVFRGYVDAFNAHDADAVGRFWTADAVRIDGGVAKRIDRTTWPAYRAFEAATHARFRLTWQAADDGEFRVTFVEDCDFYDALGSGTKTTVFFVK